jgi:hypothetical protein
VTDRDALAAKHFPKQWAAVSGKVGASKSRQQLRKAAERADMFLQLKAEGRSCATCVAFNDHPPASVSFDAVCDADSDFHGYVGTKADSLCYRWRAGASQ